MILTFDRVKFVRWFLPVFLRKPIMKAWGKLLLYHVTDLFGLTEALYTQTLAELQTNIQVDSLQTRLRVLCPDVGSFKLFVKTQWDNIPQEYIQLMGEHHRQLFVYNLAEAQPPTYIWNRAERNLNYDYHVIVPVAYTSDLASITFLVNKYKPAGKRYQIIFQNITS